MVKLGSKVKDSISGFCGIATGRFEYLYGCIRIAVAAQQTDKDGKVSESSVFDEDQLETLEEEAVKVPARLAPPAPQATTGGSRPDPTSRRDPIR